MTKQQQQTTAIPWHTEGDCVLWFLIIYLTFVPLHLWHICGHRQIGRGFYCACLELEPWLTERQWNFLLPALALPPNPLLLVGCGGGRKEMAARKRRRRLPQRMFGGQSAEWPSIYICNLQVRSGRPTMRQEFSIQKNSVNPDIALCRKT
jgi:hypothetical protein